MGVTRKIVYFRNEYFLIATFVKHHVRFHLFSLVVQDAFNPFSRGISGTFHTGNGSLILLQISGMQSMFGFKGMQDLSHSCFTLTNRRCHYSTSCLTRGLGWSTIRHSLLRSYKTLHKGVNSRQMEQTKSVSENRIFAFLLGGITFNSSNTGEIVITFTPRVHLV